jgi:hypothetical protein
MKQPILIVITCSCVFIWLSSGCEKPAAENANKAVIDQNPNKIPSSVAGTWQMRAGVWRMVIEPNGIVSSALIPVGEVVIRPHQTTTVAMIDGNFSTYTGGDCFAEYNPANRELFVYIEVNDINIRAFNYRLEHGSTVDRFTGPVSEDGLVWKPSWINIFDYGPEFPQDVNAIEPEPCIFDKVDSTLRPDSGQASSPQVEEKGRQKMEGIGQETKEGG